MLNCTNDIVIDDIAIAIQLVEPQDHGVSSLWSTTNITSDGDDMILDNSGAQRVSMNFIFSQSMWMIFTQWSRVSISTLPRFLFILIRILVLKRVLWLIITFFLSLRVLGDVIALTLVLLACVPLVQKEVSHQSLNTCIVSGGLGVSSPCQALLTVFSCSFFVSFICFYYFYFVGCFCSLTQRFWSMFPSNFLFSFLFLICR